MKKILILVMAILVAGCEKIGEVSNLDGDRLLYSCVDGVVYIKNITYMVGVVLSPKFNVDGTISTCLDEQSLVEYMEDMEHYQ